MNPRAFRIGNLVEYDGRIFEIDSIAEEFPTLNTDEFGIGVVDWNNIKPIPLTEEWFLSFGAEKRSDKRVYLTNIIKYGFGENPITKDWILLITYFKDDNIYFFQNGFHKLNFVHQLQNLYFALTGEELTLNQ